MPIHETTIAAVGGQGDGVAVDGGFIALTLPGERISAEMQGTRGELLEVLDASADRVTPPCPHFGTCGGCALQHWAPQPYLAWKAEQVRLALSYEHIETEIMPTWAAAPGTRRRVALHVRRGKGGVIIGFKARRSWDVVPIEVCPISDPRLVAAFPALRTLAKPFLDHPKSAPILHVTLTRTGLDVDITGVEKKSGGMSADARMRAAEAASAGDFARVTLDGEIVFQQRQPIVMFGKAIVSLPAGSFLQAVPAAETEMARLASEAIAGATLVADLFCGAGTFTFRLAETASVYAADSAAPAITALKAGIATAPGLKSITAEARDLDRRPVLSHEMKKMDAVVFDPPRAGAAAQVVEIGLSGVSKVVGISCNPTTFARDAAILAKAGFKLDRVHPIDQFLWSPHVELVAVFSR